MIACFLSNISAKYYKNPSMLSRAKNVGDVFFETQCSSTHSHVCNNAIEHHNVQQSVTVNTWKSGVFSI